MPDSRTRGHLFSGAALMLVGWGIFAFGAEFTWAYAPLLVFSVAVGLLGVLAGSWGELRQYRSLIAALAVLFVAGTVQVLPLPPGVLTTISPNRTNADYDRLYRERAVLEIPEQSPEPRTLSIAPNRTVLGLWFLGSLSVLTAGSIVGFSALRPTTVARGLMFFGLAAAMVAIVQGSSGSGEMYGFWITRQISDERFGPLINRNHTAGVLVMLMSQTLGLMASAIQRALASMSRPDWRSWVLWSGTRDGRDMVLAAFSSIAMGIAIIYTRSRSGLLCLVCVAFAFAWCVGRRQQSRWARALPWGFAILLVGIAANAGNVERVLERFAEPIEGRTGRLEIWEDAARMVRDFPLTGTGLNTYGVAALHYQQGPQDILFIEAHNDYLQIAAEGGLLLSVPAFAAMLTLVLQIRKRYQEAADDHRTYWLRTGAVIGLVGVAVQSVFDFTLQMPGAAVLFVLLAAISIHRPRLRERSTSLRSSTVSNADSVPV